MIVMEQLTRWCFANELMETHYSKKRITYKEWITIEKRRLELNGIICEIRKHAKKGIALFRTAWKTTKK